MNVGFSVRWSQISEFVPLLEDLPCGEPLAA